MREQVLVRGLVDTHPRCVLIGSPDRGHARLRTEDPRPRDRQNNDLSTRRIDHAKAEGTAIEVDLEEMPVRLISVVDRPPHMRGRRKRGLRERRLRDFD